MPCTTTTSNVSATAGTLSGPRCVPISKGHTMSTTTLVFRLAAAFLILTPFPALAQEAADSAAVATTVSAFHQALEAGDSSAAIALLAMDAAVLEGGDIETMEEYRSHHLSADIAFAQSVRSVAGPLRIRISGGVAWVTSTSTTQGEYRGRKIDSVGAELVVLSRSDDQWKIRAVHWSSRARTPRP